MIILPPSLIWHINFNQLKKIFKYSYESEIEINASRKDVWKLLTQTENYPLWNPFTVKVETSWELGEEVRLFVQMEPKRKPILQIEYLAIINPEIEIAWGINWGPFLKAHRTQNLTKISDNQTLYFTRDEIWGILSPVVHLMYGNSIQKGFEEMAKALKRYAEKE